MMLKLLTNKWVLGGGVIVILLGVLALQELRYKNTLITLQGTKNSLSTASQELSEALLNVASMEDQLKHQIEATKKAQQITKSVATELNNVRADNKSLKQSINDLQKENEDVKEYLNTVVPVSVVDRLR